MYLSVMRTGALFVCDIKGNEAAPMFFRRAISARAGMMSQTVTNRFARILVAEGIADAIRVVAHQACGIVER